MRLDFTKMHGLGNDFLMLDLVTQKARLDAALIRRLADRHRGVGFDQLLVVEPPTRPDVDFRYRIYNADGSEVAQCGNGARCFAVFVRDRRLTQQTTLRVETASGVITLDVLPQGKVRVDMGRPRFEPQDIPLRRPQAASEYTLDLEGTPVVFRAVSMGNPHAVIRVDRADDAPVSTWGPALEVHPDFPERANIGFLEVTRPDYLTLRVHERGAGETQACGTGACAAAVVAMRAGWCQRRVQVQLPGGVLTIEWPDDDASVIMTGPTARVFEGSLRWDERRGEPISS